MFHHLVQLLPNSLQPTQSWADCRTLKIQVNPSPRADGTPYTDVKIGPDGLVERLTESPHSPLNAPQHDVEHAYVLPDESARAHLDPLGLDRGPQSILVAHLVNSDQIRI